MLYGKQNMAHTVIRVWRQSSGYGKDVVDGLYPGNRSNLRRHWRFQSNNTTMLNQVCIADVLHGDWIPMDGRKIYIRLRFSTLFMDF